MSDNSKIEWTDATWTPIRARNRETGRVGHFCIHKSPGCANCYAERMQPRFGNPVRFAAQDADKVELFLDEKTLTQPLRWRKPRTIFVCSMTDLFLESVPDEWIDRVFGVMATARHHRFQVLTKRADRMREYLCRIQDDEETGTERWADAVCRAVPEIDNGLVDDRCTDVWPLPNVWIGISAEDRARKDRIDELRATPAAIRFLSLEPLLEDLGELDLTGIDWAIVGAESGPNARPMHPNWARSIRDQCQAAGVAFHFKQWGEWFPGILEVSDDGPPRNRALLDIEHDRSACDWEGGFRYHEWPDGEGMFRVGKKLAGRMLDGRTWEEMPA